MRLLPVEEAIRTDETKNNLGAIRTAIRWCQGRAVRRGVKMRDGAVEKWEEVMAGFFQSAKEHDVNLKKAGKMKTKTGGQPFPQELLPSVCLHAAI